VPVLADDDVVVDSDPIACASNFCRYSTASSRNRLPLWC